jgi:hypothetical protein
MDTFAGVALDFYNFLTHHGNDPVVHNSGTARTTRLNNITCGQLSNDH